MDVPESAMPASVRLVLPKCFCDEYDCVQSVFAERLEWLTSYNRCSSRLESQIRANAFSMSALQTEHVCSQFRIRISHDAGLRLVYKTSVNDATIICNLRTGRPLDLLQSQDTRPCWNGSTISHEFFWCLETVSCLMRGQSV